jgi:GxxExxY protein
MKGMKGRDEGKEASRPSLPFNSLRRRSLKRLPFSRRTSPLPRRVNGARFALSGTVALVSNPLVQEVIGAAIAVHRALGPGLFESAYDECFSHELGRRGLDFHRQVPLALVYDGLALPCAYRADFVVRGELLIELKAVDRLLPVHRSQVLTYLRLSGLRQALLINFNVPRLVDGLMSFLGTKT